MPFTPAHTVAVLPFVRSRRLSASALVIGSMSPDFEYFIRMNVRGVWGHDLMGVFLFDLPITLLVAIVFHKVVKKNFIDNLPVFLQQRVSHLKEVTLQRDLASRPLVFCLCAVAGALTHVVWDGFTHRGGYFVQTLDWVYESRYLRILNFEFPLWNVLQHASTLFGLTVLTLYLVRMQPSGSAVKPSIYFWVLLIAIATLVVVIRYQFPYPSGVPMFVISVISGICVGSVILGLFPPRKEIAAD
jgi:hypothetical protein